MQFHEHHGGSSARPEIAAPLNGLSLSKRGLMLSPVAAPWRVGENGTLRFHVIDVNGDRLTEFAESHDKKLHLIVVRNDGAEFRHVHPTMSADGIWSIPWAWKSAGSYRVYADFTPTTAGASSVTLTRIVNVDGAFTSRQSEVSRTDEMDGFTASLEGDLVAGESHDLSVSITRNGEPVTALEPYLGAFGHLIALREGDLAYLHVHAAGVQVRASGTAGPTIRFGAAAPTMGRYLLYFDFQVAGIVHTAEFVIDVSFARTEGTGRTE